MSAEHSPVPAGPAHRSEAVQAGTVKDLAEAIAGQIATQQSLGNTSGDFDVDIIYNNVEYTLIVKSPQGTSGSWTAVGQRTDLATAETEDFLDCAFQDADNWSVGLGLPVPITFTNGQIKKLWGKFQMGTPTAAGGKPEIEA